MKTNTSMAQPRCYVQTGQTECRDPAGRIVACDGSGQDAQWRAGLPWPKSRFAADADSVHDRLTGLVWSRDANLAGFPLTWPQALAYVAQMNRDRRFGQARWRLPNRRELRSLLCYQHARPALPDGHPFHNIFASWYWTSTTAAGVPSHAWYVHLDGGRMFYGGKDQSFMVWPVRGASTVLPATGQRRCHDAEGRPVTADRTGQDGELRLGVAWPEPRFEERDGDVHDRLTGLAWYADADPVDSPLSWQAALEWVAQLGRGWRVPNINELESLVDAAEAAPALPSGHPFRRVQDGYWSSTTSMFEPDWAWALYLDKGAVGVGQKSGAWFRVWPVRDA